MIPSEYFFSFCQSRTTVFYLVAVAAHQKSSPYEMLDGERETAIRQDMTRPSGAVYSKIRK